MKALIYRALFDPYHLGAPVSIKQAIVDQLGTIALVQPNVPIVLTIIDRIGLDPIIPIAKKTVETFFAFIDLYPTRLNKDLMIIFRHLVNHPASEINQMLVEKDITIYSNCEHHFVPIIGKVHVAYISSGKVIGLSKINRIVQYFAKRPQVQERLTMQIGNELKSLLQTDDVALVVDAEHLCVSSRGIQDTSSSTVTSFYSGKFEKEERKKEFLTYIYNT